MTRIEALRWAADEAKLLATDAAMSSARYHVYAVADRRARPDSTAAETAARLHAAYECHRDRWLVLDAMLREEVGRG